MGEETKAGGKKRNYKKKHAYYDVKGDKAERKNKNCPKCGPAVFLAKHSDRLSCGRCGYTEKQASGVGHQASGSELEARGSKLEASSVKPQAEQKESDKPQTKPKESKPEEKSE